MSTELVRHDSEEEASKLWHLSTGLVLPAVFGAELVFVLQRICHDVAASDAAEGQLWSLYILRYLFAFWYCVYVCTTFASTMYARNRKTYGKREFRRDVAELCITLVALAGLGFVEFSFPSDLLRRHGLDRLSWLPIAVAFGGVFSVAKLGSKSVISEDMSRARDSKSLINARMCAMICGVFGGAASVAQVVKGGGWLSDFDWATSALTTGAYAAFIFSCLALGAYVHVRWKSG